MNSADKHQIAGRALLVLILCLAAALLLAGCQRSGQQGGTPEPSLEGVSKEEYTCQVAEAYISDGNLRLAQERLDALQVPNSKQWVVYVADSYLAAGKDAAQTQALCTLAWDLGGQSPAIVAYLATPTPLPTDTPTATPTPLPTDTPTLTPTLAATATPVATATSTPKPKPTSPPKPKVTNTPKPRPTSTTPANPWTWTAQLVGPGQDAQQCGGGNLQIRVTVVDANGNQLGGVWVYDQYSRQYMVTGNVDSPDWGPGETKFDYYKWGGGSLCIAGGEGGPCVSDYTRNLPCFEAPPLQDLWAVGYCDKCCEAGSSPERCQQLINEGKCPGLKMGHFSWRVVFKRSW